MAKGYWIAHIDVTDAQEYPAYLAAAQPAYEKYGANFLVRGGEFLAAEGKSRSRHVVIEFPSYEAALACYHSPEYEKARAIRQQNSDGEVLVISGPEEQ